MPKYLGEGDIKKEAIKSEHLKKGIRPILACVGAHYNPEENLINVITKSKETSSTDWVDVDYYENPEKLKELKFKNDGNFSYVISPIDDNDKFSSTYRNCTGVIVTGKDKETGEDISFMSHQDPSYFIGSDKKDNFSEDLVQRLNEIRERCDDGTIDAVVIGGNYIKENEVFQENYVKSIGLLSEKIYQILGFVPAVVVGPKEAGGEDDVYYDNRERKVYIERPEVGIDSTTGFSPTELDKIKKKWPN